MPWLFFSYLTVRGDDEPPLLIQSHVSMMCGPFGSYVTLYLTYLIFGPVLSPPCVCVYVCVHPLCSLTHINTHISPRGPEYLAEADRHYFLIWLSGPVLLHVSACSPMAHVSGWV